MSKPYIYQKITTSVTDWGCKYYLIKQYAQIAYYLKYGVSFKDRIC